MNKALVVMVVCYVIFFVVSPWLALVASLIHFAVGIAAMLYMQRLAAKPAPVVVQRAHISQLRLTHKDR